MVLTVSFALFLVNRACCHHRRRDCRSIVANLAPASGCQNHTTSPSALVAPVLRRRRVHCIPHPTFVTIAIRPFIRGGTAGINRTASSKRPSEIFLRKGLDTIPVDLPVGQISLCVDVKASAEFCGAQAFACLLAANRQRGVGLHGIAPLHNVAKSITRACCLTALPSVR
jgi:hypothetical protein